MVVTKNKFEFHVPESAVQSFDPHRQSTPAGLDVEPSVTSHTVGGLGEQSLEENLTHGGLTHLTASSFLQQILVTPPSCNLLPSHAAPSEVVTFSSLYLQQCVLLVRYTYL